MVPEKKVYYDLAYIVSCALRNELPNLEGIDLSKIKAEAQKDSILPLVGKVIPQFIEAFYSNVYRNTNFEKHKELLYSFFDDNGILHCSLKGMVLKDLYPHAAMRFFADYDVLFDPQKKDEVRKWLADNDVEVLYYREIRKGEKEDSVLFNKQFHFELHYCLLNDGYCSEPWYRYFSNDELFKRLIHVSDSEYRMTDEDFYLFFLIHAYKHSSYVCDMRELIDCYLLNKHSAYDRTYVGKKLKEFGLEKYESQIRIVSRKLFDREELTEDEEKYFLQCAGNKTFGDLELNELRRIAGDGEVTEAARKKAIRKIFILPKEILKYSHPFIYHSVILRPVFHIARISKKLLNWKRTKMMIEKYRRIN